MQRISTIGVITGVMIWAVLASALPATAQPDPLPSWNKGPARQNIVRFVEAVTDKSSKDYVPPEGRIAVFDNDGTLWVEQPIYTQFSFAFDRVKALASQHPDWKEKQPFKAVLEGDLKTLSSAGERGLFELMMATHSGMTPEEFEETVEEWLSTAKHPKFKCHYSYLVYRPMLELLAYLRANGFKTFIVTGGGVEFVRTFSEDRYDIPPERVIGSSIKLKFETRDGQPILIRTPEVNFIDDKEGKPIGIQQYIGLRPIAAFGNSDGDLQMLQWTTAGSGLRLGLLVHHTDAEREYAYDRNSPVGKLDKALDEANARNWTVVDMQKDWKIVFSNCKDE